MDLQISYPMRPSIPGYGISKDTDGLISWDQVHEWMDNSKNYWISTTKSNGNPHTRPVWGIWLENCFYFGGGPTTQNYKNLMNNSHIQVHTESGQQVVIIEGEAIIHRNEELEKILDEAYQKRYATPHPPPFFRVVPKIVFCWDMDDYANTPTKFILRQIG